MDQLKQMLSKKALQGNLSGRPKTLWAVYRKWRQEGHGLDCSSWAHPWL